MKDAHHHVTDGVVEQVARFRCHLWDYYSSHGRTPERLSQILLHTDNDRRHHFSTLQKVPCTLEYNPEADNPDAAVECSPILCQLQR